METRKILAILVLALGLVVWPVKVSEAAPLGTAFTYQGRLIDANDAADGLYDFAFKLYDANVGGSKAANDVNVADVDVIEGYFTVELDFNDPNAFNGEARWLSIGVRPGVENDPCAYTTLSPRQEVTPTPYAIYAKTAGAVSGGMGGSGTANYLAKFTSGNTLGDSIIYENAGNVGIGTTDPNAKLEVDGDLKVNGAYKGNISSSSGSDGAPFPRPAYDSGWVSFSQGECKTLTHNIGGNVDNYVVDMQFKDTDVTWGINIIRFGGVGGDPDQRAGACWENLLTSSIKVCRMSADPFADQMRIRIWVYN